MESGGKELPVLNFDTKLKRWSALYSTFNMEIQKLATWCAVRPVWALNKWSARRRGSYVHNTHNRQIAMPSTGFEPAIPAVDRLRTHALDRAVTRIGYICSCILLGIFYFPYVWHRCLILRKVSELYNNAGRQVSSYRGLKLPYWRRCQTEILSLDANYCITSYFWRKLSLLNPLLCLMCHVLSLTCRYCA